MVVILYGAVFAHFQQTFQLIYSLKLDIKEELLWLLRDRFETCFHL